jgi:hypothetical protein
MMSEGQQVAIERSERNRSRMVEDDHKRPVRFRLAWRWKGSGVSGSTPWTYRGEVVEGWLESFSRRTGERVEHWIEVSQASVEREARPTARETRPNGRETTHA